MGQLNLKQKRADILTAVTSKIMRATPALHDALNTRFHHQNTLSDLVSFIQTGQPTPTSPEAQRWTFVRPGVLQFRYQNGYMREVSIELKGIHPDLLTASRFNSWLLFAVFRDLQFEFHVAGDGKRLIKIPEADGSFFELHTSNQGYNGSRVFENFLTFDENLEEFTIDMDEHDRFRGLASSETIMNYSERLP